MNKKTRRQHPSLKTEPPESAFWRSLDELQNPEGFQKGLGQEFPAGATELLNEADRRVFLKVMSASLALAGLGSCSNRPPEDIVPYVIEPESVKAGEKRYFATAVTRAGYAQGVLVESHEGRPTKVEGNPSHPASLGATDIFAQASVLTLYDPDRSQTTVRQGQIQTWDQWQKELNDRRFKQGDRETQGIRLLTGKINSPTLLHQIRLFLDRTPSARWHAYESIDNRSAVEGARMAYGTPLETVYHIEKADVIVSLDCDLFFALPGQVRYAREFSLRRRIRTGEMALPMNRLYVFEPSPTVTGSSADHRLPVPASRIPHLAFALAQELGLSISTDPNAYGLSDVENEWIRIISQDALQHPGASLFLAGISQPAIVHALVHAINERLGNKNRTVSFRASAEAPLNLQPDTLPQLVADMNHGRVDILITIGCNPVYDAPADLKYEESMKNVSMSTHLGIYPDETGQSCQWHIPMKHELESWSDGCAYDGTVSIIQPLISPLYKGRSPHELMGILLNEPLPTDYDWVHNYWQEQVGNENFSRWWEQTLREGVAAVPPPETLNTSIQMEAIAQAAQFYLEQDKAGAISLPESLEIHFQPDATVWDGFYANNAWLQELPKPINQLAWDNVVLISPLTAQRYGLKTEQVVELEFRGNRINAPVMILPGQADVCATVSLGYGRRQAGRVGDGVGFNAYRLRRSDALWFGKGLTLNGTEKTYPLAASQNHHLMEGRDLFRAYTLQDFVADLSSVPNREEKSPSSLYPEFPYEGQQWGMAIDLTSCIGCGACTIACQAENNIPVVGKKEMRRGREMHWIRVDSYFRGSVDRPEIFHQPVPCMHCEKAPCEVVCPVGATTHSQDGLNQMIYNRCIGTRYCSNNCPYKVRRFNFFLYVNREVSSLRMLQNPNVTVRGRGVMEKCTYCVQRIRSAEIEAKIENRLVRDGEVVTACQAVCPTQAIVFGDVNDPDSLVSQTKKQPHNYGLLTELNTQPRTTYLASVRNPNPALDTRHV